MTIVRPAVRAVIDWKKEMTMSPEPKTLREWENWKNIDRYSATPLTIDEASLSILLPFALSSVGCWDCRCSGSYSW